MNLEDLRRRLSAVDRDLLALVARRQELARAIGELKDREGRALRDYTQEKEVLERTRAVARDLGVPPEVAEDLMTLLIRSSLTAQERQRVERRGEGGGRRALVIGGAGRMGRWFSRFLASQGYAVEIADPTRGPDDFPWRADWREGPLDQDLIVVAAPLRITAEILRELASHQPPGVVFDIGSLKSPLRQALRALVEAGVKVTSMHPMFGPSTELLSGRHVILVDLGVPEANRAAESLFAPTMAQVVPMDLERHDRVVAYILGLSHALNIAFFTALAESGEAAGHLAHLSSTTFDQQLAVASLVAEENPHLYFEIQHLNDYGTEALSALLHAVERVRAVVRAGDEPEFAALMHRGRRYLAERRRP
jgi:chorismate mutase/prephenate dehydrogenase